MQCGRSLSRSDRDRIAIGRIAIESRSDRDPFWSSVDRPLVAALSRIEKLETEIQKGDEKKTFGSGKDGDLNIKRDNTHIVECFYVTQSTIRAGSRVVNVSSCSSLSPGDEIMFHQTQHPVHPGVYKFSYVLSCALNTPRLRDPLQNFHESAVSI